MLAWTATTLGIAAVVGGCLALVAGPSPVEGDCNLRVRFQGRTYQGGGLGDQERRPETGPVLGVGEALECDGTPYAPAAVRRATGVPVSQAVIHRGAVLLASPDSIVTEPVACTGPAVFPGRLAYTDLQPDSEQEPLTDPGGYRAWSRARQGSGLPLTGMRWVLVGVAIDEGTRPRPDPATLRRNTWRADSPRVRVAAHCEGDRFAADRVVVLPAGRSDGSVSD